MDEMTRKMSGTAPELQGTTPKGYGANPCQVLLGPMTAAVVLITLALLLPQPLKADSVTLSLDSANLTVTEGQTAAASFTFTNNSGGFIVVPNANWGQQAGPSITGDATDTWNIFSPNTTSTLGNCLSNDMASGTSCSFALYIGTFSDVGETDADFGITPMYVNIDWCPDTGQPTGTCFAGAAIHTEYDFDLTVLDPGASPPSPPVAVPEPASLLLLGAGFSGLLGLTRRRSQG